MLTSVVSMERQLVARDRAISDKRGDKMKVFLGGTCNDSTWREDLIPMLEVDYFNPVVEDWTEECMAREIQERKTCDFVLYVITPKMTGVYSIAEVVDDSNKRPCKTVLVILDRDGGSVFDDHQWKSLMAVREMVEGNSGVTFDTLEKAAIYLNVNACHFLR